MKTQLTNPHQGRSLLFGKLVLIFLIGFFHNSFAQTPVPMSSQPGLSYTENFADIANWTNNFASGVGANRFASVPVNATGSIPDGVKTTTSTATFSTGTAGGVQRGTGAILQLSTGSSGNTSSNAIDFFMDFSGVNAGTLSFDWAAVTNSSGDRPSSLRVYYSTNGTTFTEIPGAAVLDKANNSNVSGSIVNVALPAAFNGVSTARLRFYEYNGAGNGTTGSRAKISVDNLTVTAVPAITPATVVTGTASSITNNSAFLNGTVNANNTTTNVTFEYGLTNAYGTSVAATPPTVTGNTVTPVSASVSPLTANTLYHFRAVGDNGGLSNGSDATFYTLANVPGTPTVNNPATTSMDVTVDVNGNPAATEFAIQETSTGNYVQANGSLGAAAVWQTASVWGVKTVTSLTPSTTYTFQVKARNGSQVETAFSLTASGTTSAANSPVITVSASLTPFSTIAGTPSAEQTYSVAGTNLTTDITITPPVNFEISLNGTNWVSNPNTIVLTNAGGTVPSTTIHVQYNPAIAGAHNGMINHLSGAASQDLNVSGNSLAAEPVTPSTVTFGAITGNSMVINFTGGTGASRIVVLHPASAVTYIPADGASATGVDSDFSLAADQGSGNKVVYDASGTSVTVSGLTQATQYFVAVYEYNGTAATANYLATPGTGNANTTTTEPTVVSTVAFGCITDTSVTLTFTGGNGSGRIVVANGTTGVTYVPADGVAPTGVNANFSLATDQGAGDRIVYNSTGTSATVTGLTAGTTYFFQVFEYNGSGVTINYLSTSYGSGSTATSGALSYTVPNAIYSQDFNGLPSTGTFTLSGVGPHYVSSCPIGATNSTGWQVGRSAGTTAALFVLTPSNTGASYDFGSGNERALGIQNSGSTSHVFGVAIKNNTGTVLTTITVGFTGEEWRDGVNLNQSVLRMSYSLNGTTILSPGTLNPVLAMDFFAPVNTNSNTSNGVTLDGNNPSNRQVLAPLTIPLNANWAPGQTLILRWEETTTSSSDGLSIDDFTFSAAPPAPPAVQDHDIQFSNLSTTSLTTTWANGDGIGRVVIMNTTNSFTDPADGTSPTANTVYSGAGEQVVYNGTGSSVNISGLSAGTNYFFRSYGYNGAGVATVYNTTTANLNPNSVTTVSAAPPTDLFFTSINAGNPVIVNQPFSVTVEARDANGFPQNVTSNTDITIYGIAASNGTLSGTLTGVMNAGTHTITISGILYDAAENNVVLGATATNGDVMNDAASDLFNVVDFATSVQFGTVPAYGIINTTVGTITVNATRQNGATDLTYNGQITISVNSGPGNIAGTLTQTAVNGVATFSDISFNAAGTYTLAANAAGLTQGISPSILITNTPSMTELVIPRYVGSKTTSGTNNDRTPFAICVQVDNLVPGLSYDIRMGVDTTGGTAYGAGNFWTGAGYSGFTISNAFTADGSGSSGPYWIYIQPATSRFEPGGTYTFRMSAVPATNAFPLTPSLVGTKVITALDIHSTARTATSTDDGAFVTGHSESCIGGKYVLMFDNTAGTGDPLTAYQARQMVPTNTSQSLPAAVNDIYTQSGTSSIGDYVGVVPVTAGVRRIEVRNYDNTIFSSATDADGDWPGGAVTSSIARRGVVTITSTDAPLGTISALNATTVTNVNCFGASTGSVDATASSPAAPVTYVWSPGGSSTNLAAGTYTVVATDANGCSASATTTVTENPQITVTGSVTDADCNASNGAIDITVSGGVAGYSYAWADGPVTEDRTGVPSGSYTVTITDNAGCTSTASFTVLSVNNSSPITIQATPPDVCPGGSSTLTASGAVSYTWAPATDLNTTTGSTVVSTPAATITYTVTGTDGFGCQSNGVVTVTVHSAPVIDASGPLAFCNGSSVTLSTAATGTYNWSSGETTSSITVTSTGAYSVTVDYGDGCVMTSSAANVTVNNFEFAGTMYYESMGTPGGTSALNTYTGWLNSTPVSYQTTTSSDIRITNASPTASGFSGSANVFMTTGGTRNFIISGINTLNYTGLALKFGLKQDGGVGSDTFFVDVSTDGINYSPLTIAQPANTSWAFINAGGSIPATQNLRIRFSKNGSSSSYRIDDVSITGTTNTLTINAATALTTCNTPVKLVSSVPTGNVWSLNGSTASSLTISAVGPFTTTLTATGTNGCTASAPAVSGEIFANPSTPVADIAQPSCTSSTATITVTSPVGAGLTYSLNGVDYSNTTGIFTGVVAGNYSLTARNTFGCTSTALAVTITPAPEISVTGIVTNTDCNGTTGAIDITATGSLGTYSYAWADGPVTEDRTTLAAGTYTVTVSDANACATTASFTIAGISNVPLTVTATPADICPGSSSVLDASGAVTYTWDPATGLSATTGAQVTATLNASQTYTVTGVDVDGCQHAGTVSVSVIVAPVVSPAGPVAICNGTSTTLSTTAAGNYSWSPNGETTQSISVNAAGSYSVSVDYGSGCILTSNLVTVNVNTFAFNGTIYSENVGVPLSTTSVNTYTGWQNTSPVTYVSNSAQIPDVRTSNASNIAGMSGGGNIFFGSANTGDRNLIISGINTLGYSNLAISFDLKRDAGTINVDPPLVVEVSSDGTNYTPLTVVQPAGTAWAVNNPTGLVPVTSNLRIKFTKANGPSQFRVDDIKVTGSITTVSVTPAGPVSTCGTPVTLSSNIPSGNVWSLNGSTATSLTISTPGSYTVTVSATGTNGCVGTSSPVQVDIFDIPLQPTATVSQPDCNTPNGTVTVTSPTGQYSYSLNGNDYSNTSGIFSVASGSYSLTAKNAGGCVSPALPVTINPAPVPLAVPIVSATQPTCSSATGTIQVTDPVGAGYNYSIDGIDYSNTSGLFSVSTGNYNVSVTATGNCPSQPVPVTIDPQPSITFSGFSPASGCPGSTIQITGSDLSGVTSVDFNGTAATFTVINSGQIDAVVPAGATSGVITISTAGGCSANSGISFTVTSCGNNVQLNLKVFIEGFYTYNGTMDNFGSGGCLYYGGTPGATFNDVDTMRAALVDPNTLSEVASSTAILQTDGSLNLIFTSGVTVGNQYYIKINHRNSLETWSANPVQINANTAYDFTTSQSQAYGNNMIETPDQMGWMIFSGDISDANNLGLGVGYQDGVIEAQDYLDMENAVAQIKMGYVIEDITGDNVVEAADYLVMENNVAAIRFALHP